MVKITEMASVRGLVGGVQYGNLVEITEMVSVRDLMKGMQSMEPWQQLRELFQYGIWWETNSVWKHGKYNGNYFSTGIAERRVKYGHLSEIRKMFQYGDWWETC